MVLGTWIDTCCIDNSSSAELSEAINAMFRWYKASTRCYAYLSDVYGTEDGSESIQWPNFREVFGSHAGGHCKS